MFSLDFKMLTELTSRMCSRRSSQRIGALLAKALPQKYFLLESGTVKYPALRGSRGDDIIQYISETTRLIVL